MIKLIPKADGYAEHWLVDSPTATKFDTNSFKNRSGASVTVTLNNNTVESQVFLKGVPVVIVLPTGQWRFETSSDGVKYREVTTLTSVSGSAHVNLILDGKDFPAVWGRYTKQIPFIAKPSVVSKNKRNK